MSCYGLRNDRATHRLARVAPLMLGGHLGPHLFLCFSLLGAGLVLDRRQCLLITTLLRRGDVDKESLTRRFLQTAGFGSKLLHPEGRVTDVLGVNGDLPRDLVWRRGRPVHPVQIDVATTLRTTTRPARERTQ